MNLNFEKDIVLENDRVLLRPLQVADTSHLIPVTLHDEKLIQYSPAQIHTKELLTKYIEGAVSDRQNKKRYPFIIFDKKVNAYAGSTSFLDVSNKDKRIEIGATWLGRQFQKTGLNRNCKFLLMNYVFETLEFERLQFITDERNHTSRTAIEKIGGKFEGTLRSHTLMTDGFRRNTVVYSILKNEWLALKKNFIQ